jgi:transposase, IS30 family
MKHLTREQRYIIQALVKRDCPHIEIAHELGVHNSTISREIKRNKSKRGHYNADKAHEFAQERKERFAVNRRFTKQVDQFIRQHIEQEQWSPEQIVGYCKKENIDMVSIERIYQLIRQDKIMGGSLFKHTRHKLKHRKRILREERMPIKDRISIEKRPEEANNRSTFGHFEMDLIIGANQKGAILTLVERKVGLLMCRYLPKGKNAKHVASVVIQMLLPYKDHVRSITTDNGGEFAAHKLIAKRLNTTIYFTHPYCSWEKGQIENTNKLLRQYIPKGMIINRENTNTLNQIQIKINRRPRKKLGFNKPFELFYNFINHNVAFAS